MTKQGKVLLLMVLMLLSANLAAQQLPDTLRLEEARRLAVQAWPLMRQQALLEKVSQLQTENLNKNYLPQLAANARASYQSDVTKVPLEMPGVAIPSPDKDMYDFYLSLDQLIWDGGATRQQKLLQQIDLEISQQQLEVEFYKIKEQVNGLYFKILLLQQSRQLLINNHNFAVIPFFSKTNEILCKSAVRAYLPAFRVDKYFAIFCYNSKNVCTFVCPNKNKGQTFLKT